MKLHLISLTILLASLTLGCVAIGADAPQAESVMAGAVTADDLAALANEVHLPAWTQVTASPDFSTIDESWVSVYSPKDTVGVARNWGAPLAQARSLANRTRRANHRRWLDLFIKAGNAVARKDTLQFAIAVRALDKEASATGPTIAANEKIFTAK